MSHIHLGEVTKIFRPPSTRRDETARAFELLNAGAGKLEILKQTRHTLGVKDITLDIEKSSCFAVMGLSGCGKSTLVRLMNRLIDPDYGTINVDGVSVRSLDADGLRNFRRHKISMVFQSFGLFPHKTVAENVGYGLAIQGLDQTERKKRSKSWIESVGLDGYENSKPHELSGGMRQRVGLARALATDPDILLMDEPFSALDPLIRKEMQSLLLELQSRLHKTIVFITHDLDEALRLGDMVAIMKEGEVVQVGQAEDIVLEPSDDYVRDFVRDVNRGRILTAERIMKPAGPEAIQENRPKIQSTMLLDDIIALALQHDTPLLVVGGSGNVLGQITKEDAAAAFKLNS